MSDQSEKSSHRETLDDIVKQAGEEWEWREKDISTPFQFRFTEEPNQRTPRFDMALEVHGFTPLSANAVSDVEPFYDGEISSMDNYNRIRVLVFRGDLIRIYPKDDFIPGVSELAYLLHAISIGFGADVEHYPIEEESEAEQ